MSIFDLFHIGIGPSSSHTVGPMLAARNFALKLQSNQLLDNTRKVVVDLYGSLAATGLGHGTPEAILLGLEGEHPETFAVDTRPARIGRIVETNTLNVAGDRLVDFSMDDVHMHAGLVVAEHPNKMRFSALDAAGKLLASDTVYSIGGGALEYADVGSSLGDHAVNAAGTHTTGAATAGTIGQMQPASDEPFPFVTADEMLAHCASTGLSIAGVMRANELSERTPEQLSIGVGKISAAMAECISDGFRHEGILPGGLGVKRRAKHWRDSLEKEGADTLVTHASEWVACAAMAVNEENAAGGRVVTAPTNGAAGIIPAVLWYILKTDPELADAIEHERIIDFFLTAGAIGKLYKLGASISGAEVGCQGEVGVAGSMAAGALTALWGGTPAQVENAAEIAMEHSLGLTCDPVKGLVQIPCIERNAMAANNAITAAKFALRGDGTHRVSLDSVIATMLQTGRDMSTKYKETSMAGLAVNVVEC